MSEQKPASHSDFPIPKTSSIVPHEETASGSQKPQRVNNEIHELMDGYMKGELKEGTVDHEDDVIDIGIPEDAIPFDGEAIYPELVDDEGQPYYDDEKKRWHGFPGHNNKVTIPQYIEKLAHAVHEIVVRRAYYIDESCGLGLTINSRSRREATVLDRRFRKETHPAPSLQTST